MFAFISTRKYHKLGELNNRSLFSQNSGDEVQRRVGSPQASLLDLPMPLGYPDLNRTLCVIIDDK